MRAFVLKSHGYANGMPGGHDGKYLWWFNLERPRDATMGGWTTDISLAMKFSTPSEALEVWRTQRMYDGGLRPDGKPDRPLTAFTVEIVEVYGEDARGEPVAN